MTDTSSTQHWLLLGQIALLQALLREVITADDSNVDTATTLPDDLMDRIRAAVGP